MKTTSKTKFISNTLLARAVLLFFGAGLAHAADVQVTCEAGYVTEFTVQYLDPIIPVPAIAHQYLARDEQFNMAETKRLSLGFSHTFTIPDNAQNIRLSAKVVGAGDDFDYYKYPTTDGIGNHVHYTYGPLWGPKLRKRRVEARNGFENVAIDTGKFIAHDVLVPVGQFTADDVLVPVGKYVGKEFLIPIGKGIVGQHGDTIRDAIQNFKNVGAEHYQDLKTIEEGLEEQNPAKVLGAVANLAANSAGFKNMIQSADGENMGSIVFLGSAGGGLVAGGDFAFGNAFDVYTLDYMSRNNGQLPPDNSRKVMATFNSTALTLGLSAGAGANVAFGYDTSSPADISGPSLDLTFDGAFGVGANATLSWDPSKAMRFSGFTAGISGGLEVEASGGAGITTSIISLTAGELRRLGF